jgi:hypothetical protein
MEKTIDLSNASWKTSSRSGAAGHCVEVAQVDGMTAVRDSKNRDKGALVFTAAEWSAFVEGVELGEFIE